MNIVSAMTRKCYLVLIIDINAGHLNLICFYCSLFIYVVYSLCCSHSKKHQAVSFLFPITFTPWLSRTSMMSLCLGCKCCREVFNSKQTVLTDFSKCHGNSSSTDRLCRSFFFVYFCVVCNVNFKFCEYFLKALKGFPCNTMLFFLGVSCRKQPL